MSDYLKLNQEDIGQMIIGATVLSVPVAFTEEAWRLSKTLPMINVLAIVVLSLSFLSLYSYWGIFQGKIKNRETTYISRVLIGYIVTCFVVCVILTVLNKFPIFDDATIALKRMIIISLPASMGAVVVDGFDKE